VGSRTVRGLKFIRSQGNMGQRIEGVDKTDRGSNDDPILSPSSLKARKRDEEVVEVTLELVKPDRKNRDTYSET
jgi:hypothetical protein